MMVVGMGEEKTPRSFRAACSKFTVLENLIDTDEEEIRTESAEVKEDKVRKNASKNETARKESTVISKDVIENVILGIITENENKDKETGLGEIGSRLVNKYPDFDVRNYGYSLLSKFLEEVPSLELIKENTRINVRIKANKESKDEIVSYVRKLVAGAGAKGIGVSEIGNKVHEKYTRFNMKDYGYSKFTKFLQDIEGLDLYEDGNNRKRCGILDSEIKER